jgi:hypothetical protein
LLSQEVTAITLLKESFQNHEQQDEVEHDHSTTERKMRVIIIILEGVEVDLNGADSREIEYSARETMNNRKKRDSA